MAKDSALRNALDAAQPQSVQKSKPSLAEKALPIGPEYYNLKTDDNLVAPKRQIIPFIFFLSLMQFGIFLAMILYYSLPFSFTTDELISYEWDYNNGTHTCTPMFKDTYWSSTQNYEQCMKEVKPPSPDTIVTDSYSDSGVTVRFTEYRPFPQQTNKAAGIGGAFEAGGLFKTKSDAEIARNAFAEHLRSIQGCGHDGGFSEFDDADSWRVQRGAIPRWEPNGANLSSFPYSLPHENVCVTYTTNTFMNYCQANSCLRPNASVDLQLDCAARGPGNTFYEPWQTYCRLRQPDDILDLLDPGSCYFNNSWPKMRDFMNFFGFQDDFTNFTTYMNNVQDYQSAIFNAQTIAAQSGVDPQLYDRVKNSYRRDADFAVCTVTEQLAIEYFEAWYAEYVCAHTKSNAPYRCVAELPTPPLEMLSLAYSNSLLFYTILSVICVAYFFRDVERK